MAQKNIFKETFHLVGIKTRTSNQEAMKDIAKIWERFFTEDIKNKIPNKLNDNVFAVYTAYEGDFTKPYSYILGCEVSSLDTVPGGMTGITTPSAQYEIFTAIGKMPDKVVETWQKIWQPEINAKRTYVTDFEVYGDKSSNPENSEVEIYIGIK